MLKQAGGVQHTPILILSEAPVSEKNREILSAFFHRQGIIDEQITFSADYPGSCRYNIVVPIDDGSLKCVSGLTGLDRWHCSVIVCADSVLCIPLLPFARVLADWKLSAYWTLGCQKVRQVWLEHEQKGLGTPVPALKFHIWYNLDDIKMFCSRCKAAPFIAVDIETSGDSINTVGFALSPTESMAIRVDEGYWSKPELFAIWQMIDDVLRSSVPKVLQNFIFETHMFARRGLEMANVVWDTMYAMKFLNPELEKGLANVGRLYTPFPYWKDDNKDWRSISDWEAHLTYNCKDTVGTAWAYLEQRREAEERRLLPAIQGLVLDFLPLIRSMCLEGIGVDGQAIGILRERAERAVLEHSEFANRVIEQQLNRTISLSSNAQVKKALKEMGLKLPTVKGKESLDKKSMAKLRKKYPKNELIPALVAHTKAQKTLSEIEHLKFQGERMTFSIDACHNEFGEWTCSSDPFGNGFDLTETYYPSRQMFQARKGCVLVELKLDNPITRYVAFDSADTKLMGCLDAGQEGYRRSLEGVCGGFIFGKDPDGITARGREAKLSSACLRTVPFGIGPRQFAEMCAYELDIGIDEREAKRIISTFHGHFPGIMRRCRRIQDEIRRTKKIRTPLGRERAFYDRIGDSLFREAYAYAPRATASDVTTALMRFMWEHAPFANILLKMPDAILLEVEEGRQYELAEMARDYKAWHPQVRLAGGMLVVPVSASWGQHWRPMELM